VARTEFQVDQAGVHRLFFDEGQAVQQYILKLAQQTATRAGIEAPKGKTKSLSRNLRVAKFRTGQMVVARTPYAFFVHQGTKPHLILPRRKKVLRWETTSGEIVFSARARHPGTKPNPFLVRALRATVR